MEGAFTVETFISLWNDEFPNSPLKAADLKEPHVVMGAVFQMFERLGIDRDVVLAPPPEEERNESITYYWDLIPVINMTRVINHLVSMMPQVAASINMTHFMQPTTTTSQSILFVLFNLMIFNEGRMKEIAPYEEKVFAINDEVKALEDQKHKLQELLNQQALEKGKRAERLEKLDDDINQLEEELAQEKELHAKEKQKLEARIKENRQINMVLEQKKTHRDAVVAEVARKKALRVYDADDIKAQAEQAAQDVQEAEEKLTALRATLMEKENSIKNLQTIKPSLDTANNLLKEIVKHSETLKDFDCGDLDADSEEGELDVLNTEVSELQVQLTELQTARAELADKRQQSCAQRQQEKALEERVLYEAEEKNRKGRERYEKASQRLDEINELTNEYAAEKAANMEQIVTIKNTFCKELKSIEETLLQKMAEVEKRLENKLLERQEQ